MERPKTTQPAPEKKSDWQKTNYSNLIRYIPSGMYFARIRVQGKLIRRKLRTDKLGVAKLRLADFEKQERKKAATRHALTLGKMTFGEALAVFKSRLKDDPTVKPRTKEYYEYRSKALLKSWPGLDHTDVSEITATQCIAWTSKNAAKWSSSSHNHTIGLLRKVLEIAVESGARYDNPALSAKRVRERTTKQIQLPEFSQFGQLVETICTGGSGFSKPAADLVEFLAYGGFRKSEARHVTWEHCDFKRGEIVITGDPVTGTKNSLTRRVPMIADMRILLERLKAERKDEKSSEPVMRVFECQKSLNRATEELKIKRITHHDLRHLFATRCIESGVDIPTVSRWLGHKDGGALAMKVYGHLRDQHSVAMAQKVTFSNRPPTAESSTNEPLKSL
jgi:integrase